MEIKIQCGCGTRYKFDVEPANNKMPMAIQCPACGTDGTLAANEIISQSSGGAGAIRVAAPVTVKPALRVDVPSAPAQPQTYSATSSAGEMGALLQRTNFFVRERVGILKLTDVYDILDPVSGQTIGIAKEEPPVWAKWLRLLVKKHLMPTAVNIYEREGERPVVSIRRGFTFIRAKINVITGDGQSLGYFKRKLLSIGGGFNVFDNQNQQVAEVKGNWKGWDFKFVAKNGREIGTVTKKWAGLGKELFTSADNYIISISDGGVAASALLLAAGLAIDVVFKEND